MIPARVLHLCAKTLDEGRGTALEADALCRRGMRVNVAGEVVPEATLKQEPPDLILVDVFTPTALATLETLSRFSVAQDVPLIARVPEGAELEAAARDSGAWQVLPESLPSDLLAVVLEPWIHRRGLLARAEHDQRLLERTYLALLDRFCDGLFAVQDGVIVYVSPGFEALSGYERHDLIESPPDLLFDDPLPATITSQGDNKALVLFLSRKLRRKDGTTITVDLGTSAIQFRNLPAVQFAIRDVTVRRTLEEELLKANRKLQQRNRDLREANERFKDIFKQRTEFLNMVTHELRTSMTVISGYNRLLLNEDVGPVNGHQRMFLEESRKSCDRLSMFINNLLGISKMDAGRMVLDLGDNRVADSIENVITHLKPLIDERQLIVRTRVEPDVGTFPFDKDKIEQVLINLVGNAIKFTPASGTITVRARRASQQTPAGESESALEISVIDTGVGIPEKDVETVFDEFSQVERPPGEGPGESKGIGLGLAICRRIVEAHGGRIWARSDLHVGTTLTFILPNRPPLSGAVR
jgi:PAS domain S-box-containing protein